MPTALALPTSFLSFRFIKAESRAASAFYSTLLSPSTWLLSFVEYEPSEWLRRSRSSVNRWIIPSRDYTNERIEYTSTLTHMHRHKYFRMFFRMHSMVTAGSNSTWAIRRRGPMKPCAIARSLERNRSNTILFDHQSSSTYVTHIFGMAHWASSLPFRRLDFYFKRD